VAELRYARTADGAHVAFRELPGAAGTPIVYLPGMVYSIESVLDDPPYARFIDGLTELGPVVLFERQGIAASDALDPARDVYDQWTEGLVAVLDEIGAERAALVGYLAGADLAIETAVRHPDRVAAVVAFHCLLGVPAEFLDAQRAVMANAVSGDGDAQQASYDFAVPSRAADPDFLDWNRRAGRIGANPKSAAHFWDAVLRHNDLDDRARELTVPLLALGRRDFLGDLVDPWRATLDAIPGATVTVLDGRDALPNAGDVDGLVVEIASFLGGDGTTTSASRPVRSILFTDLVGSTTSARARGDAGWRALLDHHDQLVEQTVRRHGGRLVKTTGDGALIVFDTPSRALRGAVALRAALDGIGLGVRMGIHLGEVETRGTDVAGVAVHLAARVMGAADDGEILTTAALPLSTLGGGFAFAPVGSRPLKGFDEEYELFRLAEQD
jgi:class 3 adenylate cyclase/pimeloyl-ACP methyl ester carboxylesterase